jgi:hypothetical protein
MAASRGKKRTRGGPADFECGPYTFKVLCTDHVVSALIGKGGGALRELTEGTGAKLDFSRRDNFFPTTSFRVVTARSADRDAVYRALEAVVDRVAEAARDNDEDSMGRMAEDCKVVVLLSHYTTGSVLGRGGQEKERLCADTSCHIDIEKHPPLVADHQRVEIRGGVEDVKRAVDVVCNKVQDEAGRDWFSEWAARDPLASATSSSSTAPVGGKIAKWSGRYGVRSGARVKRRGGARAPGSDSHTPSHDDLLKFRNRCPMNDRAWDFLVATEGAVQSKVLLDFNPGPLRDAAEDYTALVLSFTSSVAKRFRANPSDFCKSLSLRRADHETAAAEEDGEVLESGGLEALTAALQEAPRKHLDVEYLISCKLPGQHCLLMEEQINDVMEETTTQIELGEADDDGMRCLTITGFLADMYTAHLRLMLAFNTAAEDGEGDANETADKVRQMQDQIAQLQAQLESVKNMPQACGQGVGKGKGRNGRK